MVNLEQYKKTLGEEGRFLSDEEILRRSDLSSKLASNLFDMWRNDSKKKLEHTNQSELDKMRI